MTITFTYERDTKRTYRYKEDSDNPIVGTLYMSKASLGDNPPKKLIVEIRQES